MAMLSRDEFDTIEFGAARTGDHRAAALQMSQLASSRTQSDEMSRAEALLRAGEQWLLADDPPAAADDFRRALADGGATAVEARVSLARALFQLGQPGEARELIGQLEEGGRTDPKKCDLVAELLVEQSDMIGALDWANTGVELCLAAEPAKAEPAKTTGLPVTGSGADDVPGSVVPRQLPPAVDRTELRMLLSLRYRIRNDMGLEEDAYDKLLDEF
ncbi:MAG: tetratricopeptide repeat protein [Streptosporangiaceae bacterium]